MLKRALITALVAGTIAAGGCGDDDGGGDSTSTIPTVEASATQTAPASQPTHGQGKQSAKPSGKTGAEEKSDTETVASACPAGYSEAECKRIATAIRSSESRRTASGECPGPLTKAECRKLIRAASQSGPSRETKSGECITGLTKEQCEELVRQMQEGSG